MSYPVFEPYLDDEETLACKSALDCKYLGMGSIVGEFESKLREHLELSDNQYLVTFSTGHAALHLAFMALEIGPGDEIITPSFNNIADFQAISAVGAKPVFCDVDSTSLCIDTTKVEELITEKTKAIIGMDYGATLADHESLNELGKRYGIPIVHDAAHSFGSKYGAKFVGHQADFTMFSFDPIKNITCIDGGALVFEKEEYLTQFQEMRLIGMSQRIQENYRNKRDWNYDVHRLGFRYHMPNLHASIGLAQLEKIDDIRAKRRVLYEAYYARFKDNPRLKTQGSLDDGVIPFIFCLRVPASLREGLRSHLLENDIETGIHWTPGHNFSLYKECRSGDLSVTDKIGSEILSLPFYPALPLDVVELICDAVESYIDKASL